MVPSTKGVEFRVCCCFVLLWCVVGVFWCCGFVCLWFLLFYYSCLCVLYCFCLNVVVVNAGLVLLVCAVVFSVCCCVYVFVKAAELEELNRKLRKRRWHHQQKVLRPASVLRLLCCFDMLFCVGAL